MPPVAVVGVTVVMSTMVVAVRMLLIGVLVATRRSMSTVSAAVGMGGG